MGRREFPRAISQPYKLPCLGAAETIYVRKETRVSRGREFDELNTKKIAKICLRIPKVWNLNFAILERRKIPQNEVLEKGGRLSIRHSRSRKDFLGVCGHLYFYLIFCELSDKLGLYGENGSVLHFWFPDVWALICLQIAKVASLNAFRIYNVARFRKTSIGERAFIQTPIAFPRRFVGMLGISIFYLIFLEGSRNVTLYGGEESARPLWFPDVWF